MRRRLGWFLVGLCVGGLVPSVSWSQGGVNPLMMLQGTTDAANALVITMVDATGSVSAASALANLRGKVDAANALVVTCPDNTCGGAPFTDTTSIVEGSADATKELRFEVDGFTTGTVRVLTPPNADGTIAVLGTAQTWTAAQTYDDVTIGSQDVLGIGGSTTAFARILWRTAQTPDSAILATGTTSNHWIITDAGDISFDFAHAATTNPTLFIHSANQSTTEWISFIHDQTNGVIDVGTGLVTFPDVIKAGGYQSSDGSAGITGGVCTSFKNGLCVA